MQSKARGLLLTVIALLLLLFMLAGVVSLYFQGHQSERNTEILRCQAVAEQQFRRDIVDLLSMGRGSTQIAPLLARMQAESHVDYTHLDHGHCAVGEKP